MTTKDNNTAPENYTGTISPRIMTPSFPSRTSMLTPEYMKNCLDDETPVETPFEITQAQLDALWRKWLQSIDSSPDAPKWTFQDFVSSIQPARDCIMVQWAGMWLGIETDGYTHS